MALPLIPLLAGAALLGGSTLIVRRMRRDPRIAIAAVQSEQILRKWEDLGGERGIGTPIAPMYASPAFDGVALQGFKRKSDGDRSTIYAHAGGTFLVRGGFYGVYTGNEKQFGLPLSDEYATKVSGAKMLGAKATIPAKQQDFQNGKMVWLKERKRILAYVKGKLVYDSKPPKRERAWYEEIGVGDALMLTLASPTIINVGIGAVVGPELQKGLLSKIPVIGPIAGGAMYELQRGLNTYTCKAGGAINEKTGTGARGVNGLCRAYMAKQGKPTADALFGAGATAAKGAATSGGGES